MTTTTELIVLNYTKIKDTSIVIHTLSRDFGRRSFIVTVGKAMPMAMFQSLGILEAEIVENSKSDLWRARNLSAKYPLEGLRGNLYKNTIALFMSEVLYRTIKEGTNEEGLTDWCIRSILTLDAMESDFSNYHLRFLLEFAITLGFAPCAADLEPFAGDDLPYITALLDSSFAEFMLIKLTGEKRNAIANILLKYISYHCESQLNIQSLKILREIFA